MSKIPHTHDPSRLNYAEKSANLTVKLGASTRRKQKSKSDTNRKKSLGLLREFVRILRILDQKILDSSKLQ